MSHKCCFCCFDFLPKKGFKIELKETEIIFQSDNKNYKSKSYRKAKTMLIEPLIGDFESVEFM